MTYKQEKKLEELVKEYHWCDDGLFVIIAIDNLKEFVGLIKGAFKEYGSIENAIIYNNGDIGISSFDDVLDNIGVAADMIFEKRNDDW